MSSLYASRKGGVYFTDEAVAEGIGAATRKFLSFGIFFFDYDLDGREDLLQVNGHLEDEIATVQPGQEFEQRAQLFWNAGPDARTAFLEVASRSDRGPSSPASPRTLLTADPNTTDCSVPADRPVLRHPARSHSVRSRPDPEYLWVHRCRRICRNRPQA